MPKTTQQYLSFIKRLNALINRCYLLSENTESWYEYAQQLMQNDLARALAKINKDQASLQEIIAFIQQVKKLFLTVKQDSKEFNQILHNVERILYDAVYEELKTIVTTKPHNAAVVRLWLRPEDLKNPNRKILGVASGGHLAVELNVDFYQHYFSFVTDGSLVAEETGLGKAAKAFSFPSPDTRKGIFVRLDEELKRLFYFDPRCSYADLQEVIIPCGYAGMPIGLSANKLVNWAVKQLENPNLNYGFYNNNCATVVANALKTGDAENYKTMPFAVADIKAPREVFQYAQAIAAVIAEQRFANKPEYEKELAHQEWRNNLPLKQKSDLPSSLMSITHAWESLEVDRRYLKKSLANSEQKNDLIFCLNNLNHEMALPENQKWQLCLKRILQPKHDENLKQCHKLKKALMNDSDIVQGLIAGKAAEQWIAPIFSSYPNLVAKKLNPGFFSSIWQRVTGTDIRAAVDAKALVTLAKSMVNPAEDLIDIMFKKYSVGEWFRGQPNYREIMLADKTALQDLVRHFVENADVEAINKIKGYVDIEQKLNRDAYEKVERLLNKKPELSDGFSEDEELSASTSTSADTSDSETYSTSSDEEEYIESDKLLITKQFALFQEALLALKKLNPESADEIKRYEKKINAAFRSIVPEVPDPYEQATNLLRVLKEVDSHTKGLLQLELTEKLESMYEKVSSGEQQYLLSELYMAITTVVKNREKQQDSELRSVGVVMM